ncbi:CAAX protease self-immunity [Acididesulfobacillus acetoxydans]|uniref:CAAX protease self-immunity n=1 Tax=Acididesulfobacillus acetoxydans TaxID=1561005 RepID=A0A8S0W223_9FIRM|nr:CPBP family intramembrane glutamic endopeptidase [Acididesulfobacillus acetoxydans]CAA7600268.1 CAAX protease self-immunity [Acididesulfobacillus acetoxydans]CEJ09646.1 Prokaryotic membrane lipoprotein lipid attachment site profile [Acididesulfobacillus acetoxydans]
MIRWKEWGKPYLRVLIGCVLWFACVFLVAKLGDFLVTLSSNVRVINGLKMASGAILEGSFAALALLLFRYLEKRPLRNFGLKFSKEARRITVYSSVILVVSFIVFIVLTQDASLGRWHILYVYQLSLLPVSKMLIYTGVMPGVGEEFFFRGYVFRSLRDHNIVVAYAFSALFFSLAHFMFNPFGLIYFASLLLLGFMLSVLFDETGSLWPGVVIHGLINFIASLLEANSMGVSVFYLEILTTVHEWVNLLRLSYIGMSLEIIALIIIRAWLKKRAVLTATSGDRRGP